MVNDIWTFSLIWRNVLLVLGIKPVMTSWKWWRPLSIWGRNMDMEKEITEGELNLWANLCQWIFLWPIVLYVCVEIWGPACFLFIRKGSGIHESYKDGRGDLTTWWVWSLCGTVIRRRICLSFLFTEPRLLNRVFAFILEESRLLDKVQGKVLEERGHTHARKALQSSWS